MKKALDYVRLARPWHWIKNALIIIPAFFGGSLTDISILPGLIAGFFCFSLYSSAVYIINDICDADADRANPEKACRPIAQRRISTRGAVIAAVILCLAAAALSLLPEGIGISALIPLAFLLINLLYSFGFKHIPVLDIVTLVSGFFLRVLYGSLITGIRISGWLYLTVIAVSTFLAFGKRLGEKKKAASCTDARPVLGKYSLEFLSSNMYMYLTIFLICYAIWSIEASGNALAPYTTPLVFILMMRYTHLLDRGSSGDPVRTILHDPVLIILGTLYVLSMIFVVYLGGNIV